MSRLPMDIRVTLDPLEYVRKALAGRECTVTSIEKLEASIDRLRYVTAVEFGHLNYVTVETETDRFDIAERRVSNVDQKVRRAIDRWAARLPFK